MPHRSNLDIICQLIDFTGCFGFACYQRVRRHLGHHGTAPKRVHERTSCCGAARRACVSRMTACLCAFTQPPFVTAKATLASLALLRIANGLLKRLSKSDDSGAPRVVPYGVFHQVRMRGVCCLQSLCSVDASLCSSHTYSRSLSAPV